jgi:DNA-binding GntR family transcriptional regulator
VFITETQLADNLGISRTPVRNAIPRLEQEGFIVSVPPKGYQVTEISAQEIHDIYQLKEILECYIIREIADKFTPAEIDDLEALLQAANLALEKEDYAGFLKASRDFHHGLERKFGNQRIADLLASLDEHIARLLIAQLRSHRIQLSNAPSLQDHRLILKAIRKRDVEKAVSLTREHLKRHRDLIKPQDGA